MSFIFGAIMRGIGVLRRISRYSVIWVMWLIQRVRILVAGESGEMKGGLAELGYLPLKQTLWREN